MQSSRPGSFTKAGRSAGIVASMAHGHSPMFWASSMDVPQTACDRVPAMPASFFDPVGRLSARVVDGLIDPARRRRVALWLVIAYGLAWWVYAIIAKSTQDLNADMAEMVVWAQHPALGYSKHPPLLAWVLAAWFAIFP